MARYDPLWTINELGAQVALALAVDYSGQPSGRVREVPDRRTIRYYTTLGLLDRPTEMRGRTALYRRRHLLQLVAIKRLQARGLPLAQVQERLLGLTDVSLARLARLPREPEPDGPIPDFTVTTGPEPQSRSERFWSAAPAPLADGQEAPAPESEEAGLLHGIPLGEGATLLVAASRPVHEDDVSALRTAAAPLLRLLEARHLLRPHEERGTP
jgi:DNA-binding transcriptional MerR regulator